MTIAYLSVPLIFDKAAFSRYNASWPSFIHIKLSKHIYVTPNCREDDLRRAICLAFAFQNGAFLNKDVRGWQFLTIEAAETLCMVCLPPEEHIFIKNYLGNRPFRKSYFVSV